MSGQLKSLLLLVLLAGVSSRSLQNQLSGTTRSVEYDDEGDVPPHPKHDGSYMMNKLNVTHIKQLNNTGSPNMDQNIWELSGLREGDIMDPEPEVAQRNVIIHRDSRWQGGVVPYSIDDDFGDDHRKTIRAAMDVIESKTCVRFRPIKTGDRDYIAIRANNPGCISYIGRMSGGQDLSLNILEGCVEHGPIVHELLHVLGMQHQHAASNRDEFVKIHWKNIEKGHEDYFIKYNSSDMTSFGLPYDYESIMHYEPFAFSRNKEPTITPFKSGVRIGQKTDMSKLDVEKINIMYDCNKDSSSKI